MKLLILGYADHGKDHLAEVITDLKGLRSYSSSLLAIELFMFDALGPKYGYKTHLELFENRRFHRPEMHNLIAEYNREDPARLAKQLLERADIYVGMRSILELEACREQKLFDAVIWVDASKRKPPEGEDSCQLSPADADIIVDNNGTKEDLRENAEALIEYLTGSYFEAEDVWVGEKTNG